MGDMETVDATTMRCKRLGHEVTFKYCRTLEGETVCRSIRDCWWRRVDIDQILRRVLTEEQLSELVDMQPKPPKLADLIRLAQEAKRQQESDTGSVD